MTLQRTRSPSPHPWRTVLVLGLILLGLEGARAAPLVSDLHAPLAGGGEEALVRLLYARAAARARVPSGPPSAPTPLPAVETLALRALGGGPVALTGDGRDPREFGFDPGEAGAAAAPSRRRSGTADATRAMGSPSEGTIRTRLRAYFKAAVRSLAAAPAEGSDAAPAAIPEPRDPVTMSLGPALSISDPGLTGDRLAFEESGLGGRSEASITLSEQLAPRPEADDAALAPRRSEVVAGLGSLLRVQGTPGIGGGDARRKPAYDRDVENVSLPEFARRVLSALLTSPWLYLALVVLAAMRLLTRALRPGSR